MRKIILLSLLLLSHSAFASRLKTIEWKQISHKDSIEVFRPKTYKHKSGIIPIRFKAVIDHDIRRVVSVMADNSRKHEWIPNTKVVKELDVEEELENWKKFVWQ